jgi:hypothetical protein
MSDQAERLLETVSQPSMVQEGDRGEFLAIRRYPDTPLTEKYLVVAYREISQQEGFVLTV